MKNCAVYVYMCVEKQWFFVENENFALNGKEKKKNVNRKINKQKCVQIFWSYLELPGAPFPVLRSDLFSIWSFANKLQLCCYFLLLFFATETPQIPTTPTIHHELIIKFKTVFNFVFSTRLKQWKNCIIV